MFQGRFSCLVYEGEGEVWLVGRPVLLEVQIQSGQAVTVPDSCIAAYPVTGVRRSAVAHSPLLVLIGRGAFMTRLENTSEEPVTVFLQARGSAMAARAFSARGSNALGNAVDVADLLVP